MTRVRFTKTGHLDLCLFGKLAKGTTLTVKVPDHAVDPLGFARRMFAREYPDENGAEWSAVVESEEGAPAGAPLNRASGERSHGET